MNKLQELIYKLCPNGVEYKKIGECCKIETGKLNASAAVENGEYMFFTTAKEASKTNTFRWDEEALLIAGNANVGDVKHYKGKFNAYQRTYVLTNFIDGINVRYLYFSLSNNLKTYLDSHKNEAAMTYIVLSTLENFEVAVPPLEVQCEIVHILDNFTLLSAELSAELEVRKQQFDYYKNILLSIEGKEYKLDDIATFKTGSKPKEILDAGEYEYINAGTTNSGYSNEFNMNGDKVITPSRGEGGIGFVGYKKNDFWLGPLCYGIWSKDESIIINKYLYYELSSKKDEILKRKNTGGVPALNGCDLKTIPINVPTIEEQKRIVNILDSFEKICEDTTEGLPAEIEARNKQFEYYRDILLTFKELKVSEVQ